MLDLGPTYRRVVAGDHQVRHQVDILTDPATIALSDIPISDGTLTVDRTADVRRRITLTAVDTDRLRKLGRRITPAKAGDPLSPYGALARVSRFVKNRHTDWIGVPLGLFSLNDVKPGGDNTLTLEAADLSRRIARAKFTAPYVVPAGTPYGDAITTLAADRLGTLYAAGSIATTTETTPLLTFDTGDDPWEKLTSMAAAIGWGAWFDVYGQFTLQPATQPSEDTTARSFTTGDRALLTADRDLSDDPGPNGVVMKSESTTLATPLVTVLWDTNPDSPTYWQGPYGLVPSFQSSPYIGSQDQCDAAAAKWLIDNIGGTETVTASIIPDPALDADDVLRIAYDPARIDGLFMIESYQLPINTQAMNLTSRARRAITGQVVIEQ